MFKEIVTKAVVGKGKKSFKNTYNVLAEHNVDRVLGCWVINHNFKGTVKDDKVVIDGSYDTNIWYSYDNDKKTAVVNKNISYNEQTGINLKPNATLVGSDIIIRVLKEPSCTNVNVKDDVIEFDIEKELGIEVVNDEKVKIAVEQDEEQWDTLEEDFEEVEKNIDEEVKEEFI